MEFREFTQEDIDELYEDEKEDVLCPDCQKAGYRVQLGPKILMQNEPVPADYDSWLQCPKCYWLCAIHEAYKEALIKNAIETIESPFEDKFHSETIPKRNSPAGKKASTKKRRNKIKLHEDKEIYALLRIYEDRANVVMDSDP